MTKQGTIYKIENLINGKVYIGQTTKKPMYRLNSHLRELKDNEHRNRHLQNSYNKHGKEQFETSIIERVKLNALDAREIHWIDYYRNYKGAYNIEGGGTFNKAISGETKKIISAKVKKAWKDPEYLEKMRIRAINNSGANNSNTRKVICITTGKIFNSMSKAAEEYNLNLKVISRNCAGDRKSAGFYINGKPLQFAYYEEGKEYKEVEIKGYQAPVKVVCTNTKEVFDTVSEAARRYGISQGSISRACMDEGRYVGKLSNGEPLVWVYEKDYDENKDYAPHRNRGIYNPNARKVICLNNGKVFDTMNDAAREYGIKGTSKISMCCTGKRKSAGKLPNGEKLRWKYYDETPK